MKNLPKVNEIVKYNGELCKVVSLDILNENIYGTIGKNKVTVPDAFFKAVMVHDGSHWQSIAFIMNNSNRNANMQKCAMTIDELEDVTGFDFFAAMDDNIEAEAEKSYKLSFWKL